MIYLIGSLRNPNVPVVAKALRANGHSVFDDWHAFGPEADDHWQVYEKARGRTFVEALAAPAAGNAFRFDRHHLEQANTAVLVAPAGKSAHLELGWMLGKGKLGYVLFDGEPERWDVMYQFANGLFTDINQLIAELGTALRRNGRVG